MLGTGTHFRNRFVVWIESSSNQGRFVFFAGKTSTSDDAEGSIDGDDAVVVVRGREERGRVRRSANQVQA